MKVYSLSLSDLIELHKQSKVSVSVTSDSYSYIYTVRVKGYLDTDFSFRHKDHLTLHNVFVEYLREVEVYDKLNGDFVEVR